MKHQLITLVGKGIRKAATLKGGGSALPGLVIERIDPSFLKKTLTQLPNGVVLVKDGATVGIGQGEVRRSWAVEEAIARAEARIDGAVLASDAFFFEDTVMQLHESGVKAMLSPGGSIKDDEVIELCNQYDMTLIFTGVRHFRH